MSGYKSIREEYEKSVPGSVSWRGVERLKSFGDWLVDQIRQSRQSEDALTLERDRLLSANTELFSALNYLHEYCLERGFPIGLKVSHNVVSALVGYVQVGMKAGRLKEIEKIIENLSRQSPEFNA